MRTRRLGIHTGQAYLSWIKQYILFHGKQHTANLGQQDITAFLSHKAAHAAPV